MSEDDGDPARLPLRPPPVPALDAPWSLRLVTPHDAATVHAWMHRPHVATRWDQAWSRERWDAEIARQLAGEHSRPCLVARDGLELAYVEIYRVARDGLAEHYDAGPDDLGLHVAIGEEDRTGFGLGTALLTALAEALLAADPACERIVLEPEEGNAAMHRALAKAGFVATARVRLPHKVALLHVRERVTAA
ncbi:GNAT family N-acetyltransferase [Actinomycetospora cinnamomea]|uniref:GNAT family N-acetyltransferase n=1 Tax=Actinomycetospora cinnamomea TaxID=663609 RepID=UPI001FAFEF0C|nr:GNAT family N-acetyltransferase [Actinomycetospora cinnamomea]